MSAPETSQGPKSLTASVKSFPLVVDDDFTVPARPVTSRDHTTGLPWKLTLPRDHSPTRMKAKTPEPPSLNTDLLLIPTMNAGMARRASCPNFTPPDLSIFPMDRSSRLSSKRPSIQLPTRFVPVINHGDNKKLPSPIRELGPDPWSAVSHTEACRLNSGDSQLVPKQTGLLSSKMSTLFVPKDVASRVETSSKVSSISNPATTADSAAPVKNKKSYFMRRAAAITNSDVNAIAPTSM